MKSPPDDRHLARLTARQVSVRLMPLLALLYVCNYLDRTNIGVAALQMNRDLRFGPAVYGLGAGIFFVGYALFEVPSNLVLARVGARRWIARIMVSWGIVATGMLFVRTPFQFYLARFLLGVAEAGFFPGIIYYLGLWFPAEERARAVSRFMVAIPLSGAIGNPIGGALLGLDGTLGLRGWQWLFLLEGLPSVLLGLLVVWLLPDSPGDARWLAPERRAWLAARLEADADRAATPHGFPPLAALAHPHVWRLALAWLLLSIASYAYVFWAPLLVRDGLGASAQATSLITGAMALFAAGGMLLVGASAHRRGEPTLHVAAMAAVTAAGWLAAGWMPTPGLRVAGLALAYAGGVGSMAPFWTLPTMLLRGSAAAAGIALVNSVAQAGGFAGPTVIGAITQRTGSPRAAFALLALCAVAGAALALDIRRQAAFAASRRVAGTPSSVA